MKKLLMSVLVALFSVTASADPIKFIIPFAQGGNGDAVARNIQKHLAQDINETVVVEFRPGASTEIGMDLVANANANDIVLLLNGPTLFTTSIRKNKFEFYESRLTPVYHLGNSPFVFVVSKRLGVRNFAEWQALDPKRQLTYGSSGVLSAGHLSALSLGQATGKNTLHVPYKGSGLAVPDLVGGHIDFLVIQSNAITQLVQNDQLVALAVDADQRLPALPQVPTFRELGVNRTNRHGWLVIMANKTQHTKRLAEIQQSLDRFSRTQEYRDLGLQRESRQPNWPEFFSQGLRNYTAIVNQVQE